MLKWFKGTLLSTIDTAVAESCKILLIFFHLIICSCYILLPYISWTSWTISQWTIKLIPPPNLYSKKLKRTETTVDGLGDLHRFTMIYIDLHRFTHIWEHWMGDFNRCHHPWRLRRGPLQALHLRPLAVPPHRGTSRSARFRAASGAGSTWEQ
jgi:hypothetical protein